MRNLINIVETNAGITDAWFADGGFKTYKQARPVPYEIAKTDGTIQTLEGPVNYRAGFYIMTGQIGRAHV